MLMKVLTKAFGTKHEREMKKIQPLVDQINSYTEPIRGLTDEQLKHKTVEFRERLAKGETTDQILPEAFAVCREASGRVLGMRHYDVQLIGGYVLHKCGIAEMRTGEGKTFVATLAIYLNALTGKGAHVVTVNDYLVKRDAEWMGKLYTWLGLTIGIVVHGLDDAERKAAYGCDITYATNNEIGFDYLRDNMKFELEDYVQRPFHFAIVDECDSILIDEARTPLIISGPAETSTDKYAVVNKVVPHLVRDVDFIMEEKSKTASLTEDGNHKAEKLLGVTNLYDPEHIDFLHMIYQGLKAFHLYKLDVDYMISNGEIVIVDEFTGRLMPGRRWSDGLHQAIEAKENVEVKSENQTLATITFQNFFRMYEKLSGMTGTADTEAAEFKKIYNLEVTVIPTNKPIRRDDHNDVVYKTENAKFNAIVTDIKPRAEKGQPVLVGTVSIEKSETLSRLLRKEGITHEVLNAKHHEREAEIVAQAGRKGRITIATNMAGRGTDIKLGGNPENMSLRISEEGTPEYEANLKKFNAECDAEKVEVVAAGGLYIIGTERHESRRIDNQLRGRSGRQGDPGESRFYLSLEDNLMRIFNGERIQKIMNMLNIPEDEPITAKMVTNSIENAQKKVEGYHFDARKNLIEYDDVMNQQRTAIYNMRRKVLEGKQIERTVLDMLADVTTAILDRYLPHDTKKEDWNLTGLETSLSQQFGLHVSFADEQADLQNARPEAIIEKVQAAIKPVFERQKKMMGEVFEQILKMILLQSIDLRWKEHLLVIDKLKEGIGLRGYAQKDPLIEYKKEAFGAFETLNQIIAIDALEKVMKVQFMPEGGQQALEKLRREESSLDDVQYSGGEDEPIGVPSSLAPRRVMEDSPRGGGDDQKMNRADRRRLKDRKRG